MHRTPSSPQILSTRYGLARGFRCLQWATDVAALAAWIGKHLSADRQLDQRKPTNQPGCHHAGSTNYDARGLRGLFLCARELPHRQRRSIVVTAEFSSAPFAKAGTRSGLPREAAVAGAARRSLASPEA